MLFESKTHSGVANQFAIALSFVSDWLTGSATLSLFGRMSMSLIQFGFWTHSGFVFLMPLHFAFVMDSGFASASLFLLMFGTPLAFAST